MVGMRRWVLVVASCMVLAACGGGSTDAGGDVADAPSAQGANSGSDFCERIEELLEEINAVGDETFEGDDFYGEVARIYREMEELAPSEISDDFATVIAAFETVSEWAQNPGEPYPFNEDEDARLTASVNRINATIENDCGVAIDDSSDFDSGDASAPGDAGVAGGSGSSDDDAAAEVDLYGDHVIVAGGETYEEVVQGEFEVYCELFDDTLGVYLMGPEFESQAFAVADSDGMEPGTYEAQMFVLASDPAVEEAVGGLWEIDGSLTLGDVREIAPDQWFASGTFSATASDPPASLEASFSCVGWTG